MSECVVTMNAEEAARKVINEVKIDGKTICQWIDEIRKTREGKGDKYMSKDVLKVDGKADFLSVLEFLKEAGIEVDVTENPVKFTMKDILGKEGSIVFSKVLGSWAWQCDGMIRKIDTISKDNFGVIIDCTTAKYLIPVWCDPKPEDAEEEEETAEEADDDEEVEEEFTVPAKPVEEEAEEDTWQNRLLAEYRELQERIIKLSIFLEGHWDDDDIGKTPYHVFDSQLCAMRDYRKQLCKRMNIEGIEWKEKKENEER